MFIGTHSAGPVSSAAIHAALARRGYTVFEAVIAPGAGCGSPGCGKPAEKALFIEFQPGDRACQFVACEPHLPGAAAAAFTAFGNVPVFAGGRYAAGARRVSAW